jgi:hypothetical protein
MTDPELIATTGIRFGFGALFFTAGISKSLRARSVQRIVAHYRLVPRPLVPVAARALGPAEAIAGALLLASFFLPIYAEAWMLTAGLLLIFSFAILSALVRGIEIPCGCGLVLNGHVITPATLTRNLLLLWLLALDAPFSLAVSG